MKLTNNTFKHNETNAVIDQLTFNDLPAAEQSKYVDTSYIAPAAPVVELPAVPVKEVVEVVEVKDADNKNI